MRNYSVLDAWYSPYLWSVSHLYCMYTVIVHVLCNLARRPKAAERCLFGPTLRVGLRTTLRPCACVCGATLTSCRASGRRSYSVVDNRIYCMPRSRAARCLCCNAVYLCVVKTGLFVCTGTGYLVAHRLALVSLAGKTPVHAHQLSVNRTARQAPSRRRSAV